MIELAKHIDHTLLKPEATREDIIFLCRQALEYGFYSVCIHGSYIRTAKECLRGSEVKVCSVIGFPLGACTTGTKVWEAREAESLGADEIDMVLHIGALKNKEYRQVLEDIRRVVQSVSIPVKVILENSLLTKEEIVIACELCVEAGAYFVKTSTGFGKSGASVEDVTLMKQTVGNRILIKAAGGIRDYPTAMAMMEAGADRLGLSASVEIIRGSTSRNDY